MLVDRHHRKQLTVPFQSGTTPFEQRLSKHPSGLSRDIATQEFLELAVWSVGFQLKEIEISLEMLF